MRKGNDLVKFFMGLVLLIAVVFYCVPQQSYAAVVKIKKIDNISNKLVHRQKFTMPKMLLALMSNNTVVKVTVQWEKTIDTTVLGKTVVYGSVKGYSRKVSLTAIIVPVIENIKNFNAIALQNKKFELPKKINSTMSDGANTWVDIVWNSDNVDTSALTTMKIQGRVKGYERVVTLFLKVDPSVEKVEALNITAQHNKEFVLPSRLDAVMSDGNMKQVDVSWGNSHVDTTTIGAISFEGTVKDYDEKVIVTVNVIPVIIFIDTLKQTIRHSEKFEMPDTIMADYSDKTSKPVQVKWGEQKVDTTIDGIKEYRGEVIGYNKPVILQLEVTPIIKGQVETSVYIKQNATVILPQFVNVTLTNDTLKKLPVKWGTNAVDTTKDGRTSIDGTVEYNGITIRAVCLVIVDQTAPKVESFEILTPRVQQLANIQIKAKITDAISGVESVKVYFWVENQYHEEEYILQNNGSDIWNLEKNIVKYEGNGKRRLLRIKVIDKNGNWAEVDRNQLQQDISYEFVVGEMTGDTTAPILKSIEVRPGTYLPGDFVRVKLEVVDDKSGVGQVLVSFNSDNDLGVGIRLEYSGSGDIWQGYWRVSGDENSGTWKVCQVDCIDKEGNRNIYSISSGLLTGKNFVIDNGKQDNNPPRVESVEAKPSSVFVDEPVTIRVKASDDSSGVGSIKLGYKDPSGSFVDWITMTYNQSLNLWEATFTPKQNDIKGLWRLWSIEIYDNAKNRKSYTRERTIGMDMIIDAAKADFSIN